MKHECSIVQDLLPLYLENMVSKETAEFVHLHLAACPACQAICQSMHTEDLPTPMETSHEQAEALPLRRLHRLMLRRKLEIIAFLVLLGLALLASAWATLDAPLFFPYEEALLTTSVQPNGSITIAFAENVTACRVTHSVEEADQLTLYFVEAWHSLWDDWQGNDVPKPLIIGSAGEAFAVFYVQNNGEDDVKLYSNAPLPFAGVQTLPRLTLGYYVLVALGLLAVLSVTYLLCRGRMRRWIARFWLLPASYLAAHVAVCGVQTISYALQRQFPLILLTAVLIYLCALLAMEVVRITRDIRRCKA